MLAYVKLVQSREKALNVDVLTHQKWSGASYIDGILGAIQSGSSGSRSMGAGNTETGMCKHDSLQLLMRTNHDHIDIRLLNCLDYEHLNSLIGRIDEKTDDF